MADISECIRHMKKKGKSQDQAVAICIATNGKYEMEIKPTKGIQTILVFPRGKFYIEKYQDWVTFDDNFYNQIIDSYNSETIRKPFIDKNHELKESYGILSNPKIEDDGLYYEAELTDKGVELVQSGEYMNISPTFGEIIDNQGKKYNNALISVSLTNIPALLTNIPDLREQLELMRVNSYKTFELSNILGEKMKNLEITRKLELTPEASDEAIAMAIQTLIDKGATAEELIAQKENIIETLNKKIDELTMKTETAEKEVEEMKQAESKKEFENLFMVALESGMILPAEKEDYLELWSTKKDLCIKQLSKFKKKQAIHSFNTIELNDEDKKIMRMAGLDYQKSEDVSFYKKTNNKE